MSRSVSFLIRLWRASGMAKDGQEAWVGEVRHVLTGDTAHVRGLNGVVEVLRMWLEIRDATGEKPEDR